MHTAGFERLVKALDAVAGQSDERIVIQIGNSDYIPKFAEWFRMTTGEQMAAYMSSADTIVTHAADSLLEALINRKPVVAVPRQNRFGEHIDDHQLDLGRRLRITYGLAVVENIDDLPGTLEQSPSVAALSTGASSRQGLSDAIRACIADLSG